MTQLLAIGLGYSAKAVAARLKPQGWHIAGSARTEEGLTAIRAGGYEAVPFSGDSPSPTLAAALREATHLLLSAPPDADGDPVLMHHRADLDATPRLRWIGYLSTIGVYGDQGGAWVDEETPATPIFDRSIWRLAAEQAWLDFATTRGIAAAILRLSGIYGPGRSTLVRLKAGTERRIHKPGQVFNRIHVDDIATATEAAIARGAGGVFNITDDEPAPPQEVSAFAAGLLGIESPPLIDWQEAQMPPMARSFYEENKRVRNDRMKQALGVTLRYPTYREGLRALLASA